YDAATGAMQRDLGLVVDAIWSPDGLKVAYSTPDAASSRLVVADATGTAAPKVVPYDPGPGNTIIPSNWNADNERISVYIDPPGPSTPPRTNGDRFVNGLRLYNVSADGNAQFGGYGMTPTSDDVHGATPFKTAIWANTHFVPTTRENATAPQKNGRSVVLCNG